MSKLGIREALLAAFLVASGAPLLVFWLWPHSAALQNEVKEVRERHLLLARNLSAGLRRYHDDLIAVFASLAPRLASDAEVDFARELFDGLHFRHVCVVDSDTGQVLRAYLTESAPCPLVLPEDRLAMFRVMIADRPIAMSPVMTPEGGPPRLFIAYDAGERLVVGAVTTQYFREVAARISFGRRGHAAIVDQLGRVLAHPRADWTDEARDLAALEPVREMLAGRSGVARFHSPAIDAEVIAGFAAVPGPGWGVMVPQPLSELRATADAISRSSLLVFLAGLSLSTAIALAVSRHLARGVRSVSAAAEHMAAGEAGVRAPSDAIRRAFREVAGLARSFNVMAERIDRARDQVQALANRDSLTGLSNRHDFMRRAEALLAAAGEDGRHYALFFIDVDRFKFVNDTYGHSVGDELLRRLGARLSALVEVDDLAARQSGDEFMILHRKRRPGSCAVVGARLMRVLNEPMEIGEHRVDVSVSVGVSSFPRDGETLDALILRADQAMYHAKRRGRSGLRYFDAALRDKLEESRRLAGELREALERDQVEAAFQPILTAAGGRIAGFEALARWTSPTIGPIEPQRFVALAEESSLIVELGARMRRRAFAFAARLRAAGLRTPVSINVSQIEIGQSCFAGKTLAEIERAGVDPSMVALEITESLFNDRAAPGRDGLDALRRRGVGLALDDFGKGFSSHERLRSYPIDRLKIDINFAGDALDDRHARAVIESLVRLGRDLGLAVTAEGVETEAQRELMARLGADELQGFWAHPPLSEHAAFALALAERPPGPRLRAV